MRYDTSAEALAKRWTQSLRGEFERVLEKHLNDFAIEIVRRTAKEVAENLKGIVAAQTELETGDIRLSLILNGVKIDAGEGNQ